MANRKVDPLACLEPETAAWFREALGEPTPAQALAFAPLARGESAVLVAPTGSGKTLAAFLTSIDRVVFGPEPLKAERLRVLYLSPLKALASDIEKNLRAPLAGIVAKARSAGRAHREPLVMVRTGDTPAQERARFHKHPPDILITTPESVYLLLTSNAREALRFIDTVIIDEIHAVLPTKRGAHLALSLERLEMLRHDRPPLQRIGLSATQKPLDAVAEFLGGYAEGGTLRPVRILDAGKPKPLNLSVEVPEVDLADLASAAQVGEDQDPSSIWPHLHARIYALMQNARSTMVFVGSRRLAERIAAALNELAGTEVALAHHGSVAHEQRLIIEDRLKSGSLPAIVATSSLELGIDIGAVDQVIQLEAPATVASGLQRIGRAKHQVGGVPTGVIFPKHRGDLVACAAIAALLLAGNVEPTSFVRSPLDVLAQQIVAAVAMDDWTTSALLGLVRQSAPFHDLTQGVFEGVLDMLSGRYPSDEFAELRPRLIWDRAHDLLQARAGAKRLAILNAGTIPDRGLYGVFLAGADEAKPVRVGELDEEMVFELRVGEVFLLGASSWRCESITHDRVLVSPALGAPGKMPFWRGDRAGRSLMVGKAIGDLLQQVVKRPRDAAKELLHAAHHLNESASENLVSYIHEQAASASEVPTDKTIVIERFADELGDLRVLMLAPLGTRVFAPWAIVVLARLKHLYGGDIEAVWTDDGIVFRLPSLEAFPEPALFFPEPEEFDQELRTQLGGTSLFAARFRENAGRALLLPKRFPGKRTALWAQRKRSHDLLAVASRFGEFPILLETYREILADVFDLEGAKQILRDVHARRVRTAWKDLDGPSPFGQSLLFNFLANFVYDGDAPLAERRAHALTLDHDRLRELLGEGELRELLDPEIIEDTIARLRGPGRRIAHADHVHDALLHVGDLSAVELQTISPLALAFAEDLVGARRALLLRLGGEMRFVAMEDAARYRDAFGAVLPPHVPAAFLARSVAPLATLIARFARTSGPFTDRTVALRYGITEAIAQSLLEPLVRARKLVVGAFLRAGHGVEYCDAELLRTFRSRSLARHRAQIEPVPGPCYARFLVRFHGLLEPRFGRDAMLDAIAQLQGCPLPLSTLEAEILPARVRGFSSSMLDELCASGEVSYQVIESIGQKDVRICLYLANDEELLAHTVVVAEGELVAKVRELLRARGALFFRDIVRSLGGFEPELEQALWALVMCGEVRADTLVALRSHLVPAKAAKRRGLSRSVPKAAGPQGRFVLRDTADQSAAFITEKRKATAEALLSRYGIVTREIAMAEGLSQGFTWVYPILKSMEDTGKVRRGYFVAGLGGAQFALPTADDRLRDERESHQEVLVLAATDPASPYGAQLPWPRLRSVTSTPKIAAETMMATHTASGATLPRLQRAAGARVILHDGTLVAYVPRGGSDVWTFEPGQEGAPDVSQAAMRALAQSAEGGATWTRVETLDGVPASHHPLAEALIANGFSREGTALVFRPTARAASHGRMLNKGGFS